MISSEDELADALCFEFLFIYNIVDVGLFYIFM